ncbi:MAG TPA: hypothetical protein VNO79_09915 [Actinomycetota bacterium]|nr:hypothetical protein [Actinomycetota bacterium]
MGIFTNVKVAGEDLGWRLEHASHSWVPEKRRGVQVLILRRD